MNNLGIAQALLFEPRKAFAEIAERPRYWFPFLTLLVATLVTTVWYLGVVDLAWMTDEQLRHSARGRAMSEEQIAQAVAFMGGNPALIMALGILQVAIVVPLILLVPALYNFLVGKIVGFERSFRQWFAFTSWCALPGALTMIPAAVLLATTETTQISQQALNTLSLNALFFHRAVGEPGFTLLSAVDLFRIATLILCLIGVKVWSGRSWLFAILFVGIPWALIFGCWAYFSFR
jgi:hypothetical protein